MPYPYENASRTELRNLCNMYDHLILITPSTAASCTYKGDIDCEAASVMCVTLSQNWI